MARMDLGEDAEFVGEWFLPGSSEKIPGVLHYSNGQLRLFLLRPMPQREPAQTIHGNCVGVSRADGQRGASRKITSAGRSVTLLNVRCQSGAYCAAYAAVFGELLDDDHRLDGVSFGFDILHEWAIPSRPYQNGNANFDGLAPPERLEFGDGRAACALVMAHQVDIDVYEGRHDSYRCSFEIKAGERNEFVDLVSDYVRCMWSFLMVAMGRNLNLSHINRIGGWQEPILIATSNRPKGFSDQEHLVDLKDMRGDFGGMMAKWMKFYESNRYIVDLFVETMNPPYVKASDFFVYASMLEGYSKYKYGTSGGYVERIRKVLEYLEGDFVNMDEFVGKVRDMRNDVFHVNKTDAIEESTRDKITHDLYFVIRITLLNELGLNLSIDSFKRKIGFRFLERKRLADTAAVRPRLGQTQ